MHLTPLLQFSISIFFDTQLDVGQNVVQLSCVKSCVKLLEFAHTSACACVSCFCSSNAHDFFAGCFIGCRQSMRRRRVTATCELQYDTSLRKFFVLGALVPAMLLATWWAGPSSRTAGVGNPTTAAKQHSLWTRSQKKNCQTLASTSTFNHVHKLK